MFATQWKRCVSNKNASSVDGGPEWTVDQLTLSHLEALPWRVKSSGVRQSKIHVTCTRINYQNETVALSGVKSVHYLYRNGAIRQSNIPGQPLEVSIQSRSDPHYDDVAMLMTNIACHMTVCQRKREKSYQLEIK